jgi:hypothetical protein
VNPDPPPPPPLQLDVRANLDQHPWTVATEDNTSGGYVVGVALTRDDIGRAVVQVLVQVAPDHYVAAYTSFNLAAHAVRALAVSPIAREALG